MDRHEEGLGKYPYVDLAQVKSYLSKKYEWVRNNPIKASWIGFFKGVIYTILVYEFIIK